MENNWNTSVGEILSVFRGALLSIIPWLEKARIKWIENEAYDDWDNIVKALYENIVCSSLIGKVLPEYSIAKYEFHYDDYSKLDYIKVESKDHSDKNLAFVSFQNKSLPLENVNVAILDEIDRVIGYASLKYSDLEFVFIRKKEGKKEIVNIIEISL
ncbi:MAG: hypothetical protein IPJ02_15160 [Chitinophagaceae bacterium]|nr:hypothetical protein [Chitinophagaceae bacterium]